MTPAFPLLTRAENVRHAFANGLNSQFKRKKLGKKLTSEMVLQIRESTESRPTVAKRFGISLTTVSSVRNKVIWGNIPDRAQTLAKADAIAKEREKL